MIFTILIFLAVLSVLVIAHEFGHFFMARRSGMRVNEFGLGFPPRLFAWKDKQGTEWSVNLIPLGGYVKIQGENGEERHMPGSFGAAGFWARFFTLAGGVIMNVLMAWLLLSVAVGFGVETIADGAPAGGTLENRAITIVQVVPNSPAEKSGLLAGDVVLSVDSAAAASADDARARLGVGEGTHEIKVRRDGEEKTFFVKGEYLEDVERVAVGVALVETATVRYPWYAAPLVGLRGTWSLIVQTLGSFVDLFARLINGQPSAAELTGPVGIATMTGQVARLGIGHLLQFAALLSVNLAVLNAMPFPALDGGRIVFLFIEGIRRKPNSPDFEGIVHAIGFALLIGLIIFVTYKDVLRLLT